MCARMRATNHHGRIGTTKHNGRRFDLTQAQHIDSQRAALNAYWFCDCRFGEYRGMELGSPEFMEGFETSELRFYKDFFGESLKMQNDRYKAQRHPERCRTMEQVLQTKNRQPVETILQIGDLNDDIDPKIFEACVVEYLRRLEEWRDDNAGCYCPINLAIHFDEKSPHAHLRGTFMWFDDNGVAHMGQDEALKRAGIELPNPDKPRSQYNNRKMTFDRMLRDWWIEIAEAHGYEIEKEPIKGAEHLPVKAYKAKKDAEKAVKEKGTQLDARERALDEELEERARAIAEEVARLDAREKAIAEKAARLDAREKAIAEKDALLDAREKAIAEKVTRLDGKERAIVEKTAQLNAKETALDKVRKTLEELVAKLEVRYQKYEKKIAELAEKDSPLADWAKKRKLNAKGLTVWDVFEKDNEYHKEKRRDVVKEATTYLKLQSRELPTIQFSQPDNGPDFGL